MSEQPGAAVRPRDCPYVGLDYYQEEYGAWFFGRETERDKVITNLEASRLTLLYAESGVGKSSLLHAGAAWKLRRQLAGRDPSQGATVDVPVVFSAWQDAPVKTLIGAIRTAIKPVMAGRPDPELPTHRLDQAIEAAAEAANAGLLVILDQFEEYFLYRSREPVPEQFADELARCVNQADLPANFLIAIREDSYAGLGDLFKGRIANVYGNYLHIDYLDRVSAERAIREPLAVYNSQPGTTERIKIQDELVNAVLDQVRTRKAPGTTRQDDAVGANGGRIATPLLQLVMETIWRRDRAAGSTELQHATLQRLQGVEKIVDIHLWQALRALDRHERRTAIDMFEHLVTPSGGKIAEPVPDLARRTRHTEEEAGAVLDKLDHSRIVRTVPAPPDQDAKRFRRYEIFHDVLAPAINRVITVRGERRRTLRFRRLAALALSLLIAAVGVGFWIFSLYRGAVLQQEATQSAQLTAAANAELARNPEHSARLAVQALKLRDTDVAEAALREAVPQLQAVRTLQDGTVVYAAAIDPVDPEKVVSADKNGDTWIWNVRTGKHMVSLSPAGGYDAAGTADAVAFDPAGSKVAVGYSYGIVVLFDADTGKELQHAKIGPVINDVRFVGGTGELAIATEHGVGLWRSQSGPKCCDMLSRTEAANSIAVNPGNPLMLAEATTDGTVIWTLRSDLRPAQHKIIDTTSDNDAEFNPDGREVVTAATNGKVTVYDLATARATLSLDAGEANAESAAFSLDETRIVTAYSSGTARVWDAANGLQLTTLAGSTAPVESARFDADGSEVVTAGDDGTIRVWRAQPRELRTAFPSSFTGGHPDLPYPAYSAQYSHTGDRILTVDNSGAASVFTASGEPVYSDGLPVVLFHGGTSVEWARFNHAGTQIVTADADGTVDLWHASGQDYTPIHLKTPIRVKGPVWYADFSPDGTRLVVTTADDTAEVRDTRTGRLLATLNPQNGYAVTVATFSPSGTRVLTGDNSGQVVIWNAASGSQEFVLGSPGPYISDVESNAAGSQFVTASESGAVTIWHLDGNRLRHHQIEACPQPNTASFSPDGTMIVVACEDGSVPVFDTATGRKLTAYSTTRVGAANTAEFSPDGTTIVTAVGGNNTGSVQIWDSELAKASLRTLELNAAGGAAQAGPPAAASPESAQLNGTWTGTYLCRQGPTGLSLVIQAAPGGTLRAVFNFYAVPQNRSVPSGSFTMTGTYSAAGVHLFRSRWITQPTGYIMTNLSADPPAGGGTRLTGTVTTPGMTGCTVFAVTKSPSSGSG